MAKQATNIRLFTAEQIPHPGANQQKANARPWEQVQLKMPDKRPGGGWAAMELIETLGYQFSMGHVTSPDQGLTLKRGKSLGTRLAFCMCLHSVVDPEP